MGWKQNKKKELLVFISKMFICLLCYQNVLATQSYSSKTKIIDNPGFLFKFSENLTKTIH